jgi:lysozyme
MRELNKASLSLIESFEGLKLSAYQDSVGVWTIGWGHTKGVKRGQKITREEAEGFLREDLAEAAHGVEKAIKVDISDNEFGACVSLAFNIGVGAFAGSSIVRYINRNQFDRAADAFLNWNHAGGKVMPGLTRRRQAERKLFLTPDEEAHTLTTSPDNDPPATPPPAGADPEQVSPPATEPAADTPDVTVEATAVGKSGAKKSIIATIGAGITALGVSFGDMAAQAYGAVKASPVVAISLLAILGAIVAIYWKFSDRQLQLDLQREQQAHEQDMAKMKYAADPHSNTVAIAPAEVPVIDKGAS